MGGRVTPRHMLAVFLMFPVAWIVHRAFAAWKHCQNPQARPQDADDAILVVRALLEGEHDVNAPPSGGLIHVEGVYQRLQFVVALFCVVGFVLGYGVALCLNP